MEGGVEATKLQSVLVKVRRNFISVLFPVLAVSAIYADWSRTQRYKAAKVAALTESVEFSDNQGLR